MLHDAVVPMRIDPDIRILREAPVHDGAEHAVHMGITGYPVYQRGDGYETNSRAGGATVSLSLSREMSTFAY